MNFRTYDKNYHNLHWGSFTNYIDKILTFLTIYHPALTFSNFDKKWTFLDHLPTLSCKRSLWTTPWVELSFYQVAFEGMPFYSRANLNNIVNWGMNTRSDTMKPK